SGARCPGARVAPRRAGATGRTTARSRARRSPPEATSGRRPGPPAEANRSAVRLELIDGERVVGDGAAADQVLLDDALEDLVGGGMVPGAFGVDDGDGTLLADAQAVRLRPVDARLALNEAQLGQALLQVVPGCDRFGLRGALGLGLVGAQ